MKNSGKYLHAFLAVAAALLALASTAFAHTTVRSQATEATTEDNALKIGHGCETASGQMRPVIAQSVVFPSDSPVVTTSDGSPVAGLQAVIEQGAIIGLMRQIQDRNIFLAQQQKFDANGNVIGFSATYGMLDTHTVGRVPFQFAAPKFVATSCAKRLLVKIAIADICSKGGETVRQGKVNLWIPANGSQYATEGAQFGVDGIGAPATLTINRNLVANPLSVTCGAGIDVTVTPNPADVDANLPIPEYWE